MNFSNTTLSVLVILDLVLLVYVLYRLLGRPGARSRRGPIRAGGERQAVAAESHGKAIQRLEAAVKKLNGRDVKGRPIRVNEAQARGTGGSGAGGPSRGPGRDR